MEVGKNGVTLTFYDKKLQYFNQDLWLNYFGKDVYVRYNPDNLNEVRIYDINERFICTADLKEELDYGATKEAIAKGQQEVRAASKAVNAYKKQKNIKTHDALKLMLDKAAENLKDGEQINPAILRPVFNGDLQQAVGFEYSEPSELPDWTTALQNYKNQKG